MEILVIKGVKHYPLASWQSNQHKFYHYHDVCFLNMCDENHSEESVSKFYESDDLLSLFDSLPQRNGIVYAPWEHYNKLKAIIQWYG